MSADAIEQRNHSVKTTLSILLLAALSAWGLSDTPSTPAWPGQPLSLGDALNLALQQNAAIQKAQRDLEASSGVAVQTRAIVVPKLRATSSYSAREQHGVEQFPINLPISIPNESWSAGVRLVQSIYEGGRMSSALRTAKLVREQAQARYDTVIADTVAAVRVAYADVLLAAETIEVQQASVKLLESELRDTRQRFDAGTVPRFNVLRAEVELANAKPRLIRAQNAFRIGKQNLAILLGFNVPKEFSENVPLQLADRLNYTAYPVELSAALQQALARRTELLALRRAEALQAEAVISAKAGYRPSIQLFAGYDAHSPSFSDDLGRGVDGVVAGGQLQWDLFDGMLTKGKVAEARAQLSKARLELEDTARRIELEVRTAYSTFIEAKEVLQSQEKVQEQAEEALRLANARASAGTGTQLDVLSAQTALTEARSTQAQALRDYAVAQARLERAIGQETTREERK